MRRIRHELPLRAERRAQPCKEAVEGACELSDFVGPVLSAATGALGALGINVGVVDYLGVRSACATPKLGL